MDAALNRHQLIATNTTLLPHAHTLSHQEIEDFRSSPLEKKYANTGSIGGGREQASSTSFRQISEDES